jgi:hypothetical protein
MNILVSAICHYNYKLRRGHCHCAQQYMKQYIFIKLLTHIFFFIDLFVATQKCENAEALAFLCCNTFLLSSHPPPPPLYYIHLLLIPIDADVPISVHIQLQLLNSMQLLLSLSIALYFSRLYYSVGSVLLGS